MILDAFNEHISSEYAHDRESIKKAWNQIQNAKTIDIQPQISVYYDAWLNDNDQDPMFSLVYTILQSVSTDFEFKHGPDCVKLAASILDIITGKNITSIWDAFHSPDPLTSLRAQKNIHAQIEEFLESLLAEQGNRLIIFIDELDQMCIRDSDKSNDL